MAYTASHAAETVPLIVIPNEVRNLSLFEPRKRVIPRHAACLGSPFTASSHGEPRTFSVNGMTKIFCFFLQPVKPQPTKIPSYSTACLIDATFIMCKALNVYGGAVLCG
jgi:hypothetical protein